MNRIKHEVCRHHDEVQRSLAENEREGVIRFWLGYWAGATARNTPIPELRPARYLIGQRFCCIR